MRSNVVRRKSCTWLAGWPAWWTTDIKVCVWLELDTCRQTPFHSISPRAASGPIHSSCNNDAYCQRGVNSNWSVQVSRQDIHTPEDSLRLHSTQISRWCVGR